MSSGRPARSSDPAPCPERADVTPSPLLVVEDLTLSFGGIRALDGVSFAVRPREVCGLIGPNGAGKTTVFNCLSRLYSPSAGRILFEGHSLLGLKPHQVAGAGIGRTFQNLALFADQSVLRNVLSGGYSASSSGVWASTLRTGAQRREEARLRERAGELLRWLDLAAVAHRRVGDLPFGVQKRIDLARALMGAPRLLLLDEPAAGLNQAEVSELKAVVAALVEREGVAVLLVEHHMGVVMSVSASVVALNFGRKIADGAPAAIRDDPNLVEAYLGGVS